MGEKKRGKTNNKKKDAHIVGAEGELGGTVVMRVASQASHGGVPVPIQHPHNVKKDGFLFLQNEPESRRCYLAAAARVAHRRRAMLAEG